MCEGCAQTLGVTFTIQFSFPANAMKKRDQHLLISRLRKNQDLYWFT